MKTNELIETCGKLADDKKAVDVVIMDLSGLTDIADYFVIASGTGETPRKDHRGRDTGRYETGRNPSVRS